MVNCDSLCHLLLAHRTIVKDCVLVVLQILKQIEQFLRILSHQILGWDDVTRLVIFAVNTVLHEGIEVLTLSELIVEA